MTVAGEIVDGKAGPGTAGAETIARAIEKGLAKNDLKALVVRIDSPGGSVFASERIRQALLAAKEKKIPIVVSMGSVAASGGYWVATPGDFIFAEPSTVTGSIGVFGVLPSFEGTLVKLGIGADGIKTTPLSGEPDLLHGPSDAADALIQAGVEQVYARFLGIVAEARRKTPADIDRVAQGRVWDGGTARQLGLVDGFGGMDEAVAKAAELAKLDEDNRGLTYLEPAPDFTDELMAAFAGEEEAGEAPADAFATLAPAPETLRRAGDFGASRDPVGSDHPGALSRMPAGRGSAAAKRAGPRLAHPVAQLELTDSPFPFRPFFPFFRLIVSGRRIIARITMPSDRTPKLTTQGLLVSSRPCRSMMCRPHMKS